MSFNFQLDNEKEESAVAFVAEAGRALQRIVSESGISQQAVAQKLEVSPSRVSKLLSGFRNLTLMSVGEAAWAVGYRPKIMFEPIVHQTANNVVYFPDNRFVAAGNPHQEADIDDSIMMQVAG